MKPEVQEAINQIEAVRRERKYNLDTAIEIVKAAALIKQANNTTPAA